MKLEFDLISAGIAAASTALALDFFEDHGVDTPIVFGDGSLYVASTKPFPKYGRYMRSSVMTYPDRKQRLDRIRIHMQEGTATPALPKQPIPLTEKRAYLVEVTYGADYKLVCETDPERRGWALWCEPGSICTTYVLDATTKRYEHRETGLSITRIAVYEMSPSSPAPAALVDSAITGSKGTVIALQSKKGFWSLF
jgi:hypothetical protein